MQQLLEHSSSSSVGNETARVYHDNVLINIQSPASVTPSALMPMPGQSPASSYFGDLLTAAGDAAISEKNVSSAIVSAAPAAVPVGCSTPLPAKKKEVHSNGAQFLPPLPSGLVPISVLNVPMETLSGISKFKIEASTEKPASITTGYALGPLPPDVQPAPVNQSAKVDDRTTQPTWPIQPSSAQTPALANAVSPDSPKAANDAETQASKSPNTSTPDLTNLNADSVRKTKMLLPLGNFPKQQTLPEGDPCVSPQTETQTPAKGAAAIQGTAIPAAAIPVAVVPPQMLETAADMPPQIDKVSQTDPPMPQSNTQTATELSSVLLVSPTQTAGALRSSSPQPHLQPGTSRQIISGSQPSHPTNSAPAKTDNDSNPPAPKIQSADELNSNQSVVLSQFINSTAPAKPSAAENKNGDNYSSHVLKTNGSADAQPAPRRKSSNITQDAQDPQNAIAHTTLENLAAGSVSSSSGDSSPSPTISNIASQSPQPPDQASQPIVQEALVNSPQPGPAAAQVPATQPVQVHAARIIQSGKQSEMRMEIRTQAFGGVEIHATVSGKDVQLSVGADRGDLHSSLAPELPALQTALQQHDLRLEQVRTLSPTNHAQPDFSSGSDRQEQRFQRSTPALPGSYERQHFQEEDDPPGEPITRLSVRA